MWGLCGKDFLPWLKRDARERRLLFLIEPCMLWCLVALQPHWDHEEVSSPVCLNAKTKKSLRVSSFCCRIHQPWNYHPLAPTVGENSPRHFSHQNWAFYLTSLKTSYRGIDSSHELSTWVLNVFSSRRRFPDVYSINEVSALLSLPTAGMDIDLKIGIRPLGHLFPLK